MYVVSNFLPVLGGSFYGHKFALFWFYLVADVLLWNIDGFIQFPEN